MGVSYKNVEEYNTLLCISNRSANFLVVNQQHQCPLCEQLEEIEVDLLN